MSFEVSVAREAHCIRVTIGGDPRLGRLQSLLQVLEVDSATWTRDAVLLDLRALQTRLAQEEQWRLAWDAASALRRMKKIALLAPPGRLREAPGVRVFESDAAARAWLAEAA